MVLFPKSCARAGKAEAAAAAGVIFGKRLFALRTPLRRTMMRLRPTRLLLSASLALGILALTATAAPAYHSHVEHALHELREAHAEVKRAKHNFGGHRRAALKDIDAAIHQLSRLVGHPHHKQHAGASGY